MQTHYLTKRDFASYYVETPDPKLEEPLAGQRLIIDWWFSKEDFQHPDLQLQVTIRFFDRTETVETIPVTKFKGTYIYQIVNEDYFKKNGIFTYKIQLLSQGQLLEEWHHQMWVELITLNPI